MGFFYSLFYVLLGIIVWTLPWVAFHGALAHFLPASYTENGTPTTRGVLALSVGVSFVLSLAAGYVTARLAHQRPLTHALVLALVQLALSTSVQAASWSAMPLAYHLTFLGLLVPGHAAGGLLGARRNRRNAKSRESADGP